MESTLNAQIEIALNEKNIPKARDLCFDFLNKVYGTKAVKIWAIRNFAEHQIVPESDLCSSFDKNLIKFFRIREEKIFGVPKKLEYKSPYFKEEYLESLDGLYEDFARRSVGGKPSRAKFLKFIKNTIEGLPIA